MKNVNIKVDPKLWQEAKIEALRRGQTLMEFLAEALKDKIKNQK